MQIETEKANRLKHQLDMIRSEFKKKEPVPKENT